MINELDSYENDIPLLLVYSNLKCIDKDGEKIQDFVSY